MSDATVSESGNRTTRRRKAKRTVAELLAAAVARPVLSPEEMAAYLGIGLSSAYRLLAQKIIPCVRIPGCSTVRIRRVALEAVIEKWENSDRRGRR